MQRCSEKAFAMCPTRHLCGTREDATFADNSECAAFNRAVEDAPMTNADRIRAMTDEELAKLLLNACIGSKCGEQPQNENGSINCFACRLNWLKKPVEVE